MFLSNAVCNNTTFLILNESLKYIIIKKKLTTKLKIIHQSSYVYLSNIINYLSCLISEQYIMNSVTLSRKSIFFCLILSH